MMTSKPTTRSLLQQGLLFVFIIISVHMNHKVAAQAKPPKLFRAVNGLWGYKGYLGAIVVEPQYQKARSFREGVAAVQKNGQWGFINPKGAYLVKPLYQKALSFRAGYAKVALNELWGVIDKAGKLTVPTRYKQLFFVIDLNNRPICLAKVEKGNLFGLIDKTNGKQLLPYQYKKIATYFRNKRLKVQDKMGKYGFVDINGQQIIACQYDAVEDFKENGMALVRKGTKKGFIDITGKYLRDYDNKKDAPVYMIVEKPPVPKGGKVRMEEFIEENLKYPSEARTKNITGKVFLEFIVEQDGTLSNIKVIKGLGAGCDKEAIRLLKASAPWNPGTQRGEPIRVRKTFVVDFKF